MTKLEWCRANAPDFYKDFPDDELLSLMESSYERFYLGKTAPNKVTVYHGTTVPDFKPDPYYNNPSNDYGSGLYTTPFLDKAKEWSTAYVSDTTKGYAYEYELDTTGLRILNLDEMDSMYWITCLLSNRVIKNLQQVPMNTLSKLKTKYYLDLSEYDVIVGWRADDSYFRFATDFLSGTIYREVLEEALLLGNLGIQYCLKSPKAFEQLKFMNRYVSDERDFIRFKENDSKARSLYRQLQKGNKDGKLIFDFI